MGTEFPRVPTSSYEFPKFSSMISSPLIPLTELRQTFRQQLIAIAQADPRIVGLVDYGSTSEGRGDEASDVDVALFLRDEVVEPFTHDWQAWARTLGPLLLAYVGGVGHPWAVYAAAPIPLRVDFVFLPTSALPQLANWPVSPLSLEHFVLYDGTDGELSTLARQLVGQSLAPKDAAATFAQVCGDFWYYQLRTFTRLQRGQEWAARHDFNFVIMGNLLALLRLECGATTRWRGSAAATGIEQVISAERHQQLASCIPAPGAVALLDTMRHTAHLGETVCRAIGQKQGWSWPEELARQVHQVLNGAWT